MLLGRESETETLRRLLDEARGGRGGALVVRGEAGVGKTALLDLVVDEHRRHADILRTTGAEFEMELAFAGLHALCEPIVDRCSSLPEPQRDALETAFGLRSGTSPDPLTVGIAVLSLLSGAAEDKPILCVIDDAQWLDRASARAVAFAGRRIGGDFVAMLFGSRDPGTRPELDPLPTLAVEGLSDDDARSLLLSLLRGPLDERVIDRILAEAQGNPLVLCELAARDAPDPYAGGFALGRRERSAEPLFRSRVEGLPSATRTLLLLAAAEPTGDPLLLWRAAEQLSLTPIDALPAEESRLLSIDQRVRFSHPLVRSAIYRTAPTATRRDAHAALAEATDSAVDPDRRAWHRAQAAAGPDEAVAQELVRSAGRAQTRGGAAAAAAFLARAATLTPAVEDRAQRTLQAAEAKLQAGAPAEAEGLISKLDRDSMSELLQARTDILLGLIAYGMHRGSDAAALLRRAARRLEPLDARLARDTHLDALLAGLASGALGEGVAEVASTASSAPGAPDPPTALDAVLDGMALVMSGQRQEGTKLLQGALDDPEGIVWMGRPTLTCVVTIELWDLDAEETLLAREVARLRSNGSLTFMPGALSPLAASMLPSGRFRDAEILLTESDELAKAMGIAPLLYPWLHLAAIRGDVDRFERLAEEATSGARSRGEGLLVSYTHFATAMLLNGRADYAGALAAAEQGVPPLEFSFEGMRLRELIEAASHADEPRRAADAFAALEDRTRHSDTPWGRGTEATCRAMVTDGPAADARYREALHHFADAGLLAELGRTELLYGEWLRRTGHRGDARKQLTNAFERLSEIGAEGFAERARRELRATGARSRRRSPSTYAELSPQELQVARLVATGATTKEVAGELYLSPRTIDAHLRSIFAKLGLTSRRELRSHPLFTPAAPTGR